mgnify:CR=1 FL=1
MKGIFESMFDLNHDGNISPLESAMEFTFLNELLKDDSEVQTELELSGLDPDELEFMDANERREALEDAGLDPDEYDSKEGAFTMAKVFITLTGTKHYFGNDFLEKGTKIRLEKEPDNEYDKEAIKVTYKGLGKIGYVANSSYTVIGESMSAGRLYDKIGDVAYARVVLVTPVGTICKICKKSLAY